MLLASVCMVCALQYASSVQVCMHGFMWGDGCGGVCMVGVRATWVFVWAGAWSCWACGVCMVFACAPCTFLHTDADLMSEGQQQLLQQFGLASLNLMCTCAQSRMQVWDMRTKRSVQTFKDKFPVCSVAFADAGDQVYSAGVDNTIKV